MLYGLVGRFFKVFIKRNNRYYIFFLFGFFKISKIIGLFWYKKVLVNYENINLKRKF